MKIILYKQLLQHMYYMSHQLTYTIIDDGKNFDLTEIHRLLKINNWRYIEQDELLKKNKPYIDMIWITAERAPHEIWNIQCSFKNMLSTNKRIITDKNTLHCILQNYYPKFAAKHLAKTWLLKDINDINNDILIIRPSGRGFYSGHGIDVISTNEELYDLKKYYSSQKFINYKKLIHKKTGENIDVIASKYITNPLLWNGYKFHVRMYLLIHTYPTYNYMLWNIGKMMTSKLPFENAKYNNHDIHDTHQKSTPRNLFFPKDTQEGCHLTDENILYIYKQLHKIADRLGRIMKNYAKSYSESRIGCEIFGLDLMINDKLDVILIEVNDRVGYAPVGGVFTDDFTEFCRLYFNWIYENAIKPVEKDISKL